MNNKTKKTESELLKFAIDDFYLNTQSYIEINRIQELSCIFSDVRSSFNKNEYWRVFYFIGRYLRMQSILELGVLHGHSLLAMAIGASDGANDKLIIGYDLFEDYPFVKSSREEVEKRIKNIGLNNIELHKKSVMNEHYEVDIPLEANIIMIDLSNCGDVVSSIIEQVDWENTDLLIFEGGSQERDRVQWMLDFERKPMFPIFEQMKEECHVLTLNLFPGLTLVFKKTYDELFNH
jgi:hypothetical protein